MAKSRNISQREIDSLEDYNQKPSKIYITIHSPTVFRKAEPKSGRETHNTTEERNAKRFDG